jgi:sodium-dependent dicarboxylate transporter 2/3/5
MSQGTAENGSGRGVLFWRRIGLLLGLCAFLAIAYLPSGLHEIPGKGSRPALAAATAVLMAVWWFFEALPIHWTACVPLVLFPLLDIHGNPGIGQDAYLSALPYVNPYIFLFMGGMMIGAASEEWNLHRRVALHIMRAIGASPRRLLLGVLVATAFVSMWISNTATAVMMMPIGMALIAQLEKAVGGRKLWSYGTAIMLAVAYASNVGGIGTKIGTGPNSIFCGFVGRQMGTEISFLKYIALGAPFVILFIPLVWAALWRLARRDDLGAAQGRNALDRELASMGPMSVNERKVLGVFLAAAGLWMAGGFLAKDVGAWVVANLGVSEFRESHYEASVAMLAGLALVPLRALSWRAFVKIPWSALVLLGGGFAMAEGIKAGGLEAWMAAQLRAVADLPLFWQLGLAALVSVGLSAVASNTATITVMLGVLPRNLAVLFATTVGTSCDFMLPAGTPPNAIVFGSGYIRLPVMMRTGFWLDLAAIVLITLYGFLYVRHLF